MQVDPIKPTLKPTGTKVLKVKGDVLVSNFAFNFNLRHHILAASITIAVEIEAATSAAATAAGAAVQAADLKVGRCRLNR